MSGGGDAAFEPRRFSGGGAIVCDAGSVTSVAEEEPLVSSKPPPMAKTRNKPHTQGRFIMGGVASGPFECFGLSIAPPSSVATFE